MTRPVAILGGGGHARVVLDVLRLLSHPVLGVIDPKRDIALPGGVSYLGADLGALSPGDCALVMGVGSVDTGTRNPRPRLFETAKAAGFEILSLCHPSAIVAADLVLGEGSQIMAGAIVQPGSSIGRNVIVNTGASVDHDCRIGDHVHIAPGVTLSGGVSIGDGTHLGTGAIVVQGIVVGAEAMICAGSVVTRAVAAGTRVRPAR